MNVPLMDLTLQHGRLKSGLRAAFERVLRHGRFILGPEMELLEKEIAKFCGAKHAIACASGSDALLLALMAYEIGPGDEVITSPYSFFATASCIARVGARAVFADISLEDYNLDPKAVLGKISSKTRAILPVHLYGQAADMRPWLKQARQRGIRIIEDAAQAIGTRYHGKPVGALGDIGCLSFFPTKNLGGMGDGGMLLANNSKIAEKLRVLRVHGSKPKYHHPFLGVNSRLDTLQAALLQVKLPHLNSWAKTRRKHAALYARLLIREGLADPSAAMASRSTLHAPRSNKPLVLPLEVRAGHVYNQFVLRCVRPEHRDPLRERLRRNGVGTEIYYPVPLHLQKCFACWRYRKGDFPNSELAAASTLALPIFPELKESQIRYVVEKILSFF